MCLYCYTVMERNHDGKSSEKSFKKLVQSSTILFYMDKCHDFYYKKVLE